jgi:hypothetical protein
MHCSNVHSVMQARPQYNRLPLRTPRSMSTVHSQLAHAHFMRRERAAAGVAGEDFLLAVVRFFIGGSLRFCDIVPARPGGRQSK